MRAACPLCKPCSLAFLWAPAPSLASASLSALLQSLLVPEPQIESKTVHKRELLAADEERRLQALESKLTCGAPCSSVD